MSTDGKSGGSSGEEVQFIEWHVPGLLPGTYRLTVRQELEISRNPTRTFTRTCTFVVDGQRSALQPDDIVALYPPDGSVGDYDAVLPHVVLSRSTLPWERVAGPVRSDKYCPWLAVLLLEDGEKQPPADGLATAGAINVRWSLLRSLLPPTVDDLMYLAHVRHVCDEQGRPKGDELAVVLGNRLPVNGGTSTVHLVSVENLYDANGKLVAPAGDGNVYDAKGNLIARAGDGNASVSLISYKSWSFACQREPGGFEALLRALNRTPPTLRLPDVGQPDADRRLAAGQAPLPHGLRRGGRTVSWYRGPLAPADSTDQFAGPVRAADALLRFDPATGLFDVSYAAAWELGRLLALRSKAVSRGLFLWKRAGARETRRREQASTGPALPIRSVASAPAGPPPEVARWFDGLRTLVDVPFNYLVPKERMLPPDSIRFFCIDRVWIASLLDGAASIGRDSQADLERDRDLVKNLAAPPSDPWSGILLRSSVVSGWPGLLVDAADAARRTCTPVRIDRLSPNILLAIFKGQLDCVSFHLQPELLHFGFDQRQDPTPGFYKKLRTADGAEDESVQVDPIPWLQAPDAPTAARVFSASGPSGMAAKIRDAFKGKTGDPFQGSLPNSAQFALQMSEGVPRVTFWRRDVPLAT